MALRLVDIYQSIANLHYFINPSLRLLFIRNCSVRIRWLNSVQNVVVN